MFNGFKFRVRETRRPECSRGSRAGIEALSKLRTRKGLMMGMHFLTANLASFSL